MGCFSYMCKKCDKHIFNDKYGICEGEEVILYLLKGGKVVEEMYGLYDSYGRVIVIKDSYYKLNGVEQELPEIKKSIEWKYDNWSPLIDLHFNDNEGDGFAAIHKKCNNGIIPTTISEDDPDQGWESEDEEDEY